MGVRRLAECVSGEEVARLHETLKTVCDVNRLRSCACYSKGEKCVCDIEEGLGMSQPLASRRLTVLRQAGLAKKRRQATRSYYTLHKEAMKELNRLFGQFLGAHIFPVEYPPREEREKVSRSADGEVAKE